MMVLKLGLKYEDMSDEMMELMKDDLLDNLTG